MVKMFLEWFKEDLFYSVFCNMWVIGGYFCSVNGYLDNVYFIVKNLILGI